MATRFYGVPTTAAPVNPGFGAWTTTAQAVRRKLALTKSGTAETLTNVSVTSGAGNNALAFQLVSDPLGGAQTITGTVTIVTRGRELAANDNIQSRIRTIKVYSNDGSTLRGTLLALGAHSVTTELGLTLAGYPAANAQALSSVSAQDGDRIVVELGYGMTTTGTTPLYDMSIGGTGTDHANAEGDTTGTIPWVEFSQNLVFQANVALSPATITLTPQPLTIPIPGVPNITSIATYAVGGNPSSPQTFALPGSSQAYVAVVDFKDEVTPATLSPPSGWTVLEAPRGNDMAWTSVAAYYANATDSPGTSWSWTGVISNAAIAIIGLDAPITYIEDAWTNLGLDGALQGNAGTAPAHISPNVDADQGALVIRCIGSDFYNNNSALAGLTYPPGTSNQTGIEYNPGALGDDAVVAVCTSVITAAGSTGTVEWISSTPNWYQSVVGTIVVGKSLGGAASVALSPATITLSPQAVQPSRSVALSPATITLAPQPVQPSRSVALSPATITLAPQPILAVPSVALAAASLTLAPGQLQPSRTVALSPATITLAPQAIVATPIVALAPATITLTPQPLSPAGTGGVALAAATVTLTPQPLVPSQSVALSPVTITLAPQSIQPSRSVALSAVTITLAPQPIVATPSAVLSAAQLTLSPQPLTPSLPASVALSPVTITLAPQPLRPSQSVQLAAATLTLSPAPLQPSQSVALSPVVITLAPQPLVISGQAVTISLVPATITLSPRSLVPTPSVTLNPVTLTLAPVSVTPIPSVALAPVIMTLSPRPLGVLPVLSVALAPVNATLTPTPLRPSQSVQLVAVQLTLAPQPVFASGVPPKFLTLVPVMIKIRARPLRPKAIPVEYEFVVRLDRAPELVTVDRAPVDVRLAP
jgi:hypothetical protein